jgi:hypothetical protein
MTFGPQMDVKGRKHLFHDAGLGEIFAKTLYRRGVGNLLADVQPEKTGKGVPIKNLKLGRVVRQVVERLEHEDFEQQNDIVPLGPSIGLSIFVPRLLECRAKHLPLNRLVELGKRIAVLVDFVQAVLQIKEAGLNHRWSPSSKVVASAF